MLSDDCIKDGICRHVLTTVSKKVQAVQDETNQSGANLSPAELDPGVLLPTGSEERGVLGVGSIPVAKLPSCEGMKTIALQLQQN